MRTPERVLGIDFSGGVAAGNKIWIAEGVADAGDEALRIVACRPAAALPGSGAARERALPALAHFLAGQGSAVVGCDFPFGLPLPLVEAPTWDAFVRGFARRYPSAEAFRDACRRAAGSRELRRHCDVESRTPFSPYNLRIYRQTYAGIAALLAPLACHGSVCVLPMQTPVPGRPWLIEVCPASALKREPAPAPSLRSLYVPYKGNTTACRAARLLILEALERYGGLELACGLRETVLRDDEGDALDSVIAALAAFRAQRSGALLHRPQPQAGAGTSVYELEGYVYT